MDMQVNQLSDQQLQAISRFASRNGRQWKSISLIALGLTVATAARCLERWTPPAGPQPIRAWPRVAGQILSLKKRHRRHRRSTRQRCRSGSPRPRRRDRERDQSGQSLSSQMGSRLAPARSSRSRPGRLLDIDDGTANGGRDPPASFTMTPSGSRPLRRSPTPRTSEKPMMITCRLSMRGMAKPTIGPNSATFAKRLNCAPPQWLMTSTRPNQPLNDALFQFKLNFRFTQLGNVR